MITLKGDLLINCNETILETITTIINTILD
jgi:hypothetical protein